MKVLAIALDAASFSAFQQFSRYMPNLGQLRSKGLSGILRTVPPPTTSIGFPAMFQGLNPGKSRSFCFDSTGQDYRMTFFDKADKLVGDRVWDILSREGFKCLVFNLPMTYPAKPINGVQIASYDATGDKWASDEVVKGDLAKWGFIPWEKNIRDFNNLQDYARYWFDRTQLIKSTALKLLRGDNYDFAFIGFLILDRLQHQLMHLKQGEPLLRWAHKLIDDAIGELIEATKPEYVVIASDHGMHPVSRAFNLNTMLLEKGFIQLKSKARELFFTYPVYLDLDSIDFTQTYAWSVGQGAIVINDDRFHNKVTNSSVHDALFDILNSELDPATNASPFEGIFRKDEVWSGPYLKYMPDILCLPNSKAGYFVHWVRIGTRRYQQFNYSDHDMNGFYCVSPASKTGEQIASILDITPTILTLMEVKLPNGLDGRTIS